MRGKILVVDDERSVREVLVQFLKLEDFDVVDAANGAQAIEMARTHKPDLMVLDMMMPGMNGLEVLKMVKKEIPQMPVIILSGVQEEKEARKAIELGAYDYIVKPIRLDHFLNNFLNRIFE